MPQAGTVHLFVFIQPVDCFIPGDCPEVFIVRKDEFLVFDGEEFSFVHTVKYEKFDDYIFGKPLIDLENQQEFIKFQIFISNNGGEFMKKLSILIFAFASLSLIAIGCGCDGENPSVILTNNGTGKADIQVKTSGGNTININNIQPGTSSASETFAPGDIEFTIAIQGVADPVLYTLHSASCYDYVVTVNPDNSVTSSGNER